MKVQIVSDHSRYKGKTADGEKLPEGGWSVTIAEENEGRPMWFADYEVEPTP